MDFELENLSYDSLKSTTLCITITTLQTLMCTMYNTSIFNSKYNAFLICFHIRLWYYFTIDLYFQLDNWNDNIDLINVRV